MTRTKGLENPEEKAAALALAVAGGGCAATATQIIVLRECLAIFYGSELTVGLVLFFWLLWTGLGSLGGGRLCLNLFPTPHARLRLVFVFVVLYAFLLPLTVLWVRASRSLFGVGLGELAPFGSMALVIAAATGPVCGFFGTFFASAWAVYADLRASPRESVRLYALEALGSTAGGIWLYLFLAPRRPLLYGAAFLGATLAAFGFWALAAQTPNGRRIRYGFLAVVAVCTLLASGLLEEASRRRQWGPSVVAVVDTPYRNIALLHNGSLWSLMADGLWLFSYPDPQSAEDDIHLLMLQHPEPKRVLVLGPLSPESLEEILRYPAIERVDVVDPERTVSFFAGVMQARGAALFREDPRVFLWDADIRRFVEKAEASYDVVLLGAGDPFSLSTNRFYTQEFYRSLTRILRHGGLFGFGVLGAEDMLGDTQAAYFRGVARTLQSVFPHYVVYPGARVRLVASRDSELLTQEPEVLSRRAQALGLTLRYVRSDRLHNLLDPLRLAYFRSLADREGRDEINKDMDPRGFIAALRLWAAQFHPRVSALMHVLDRPSGSRVTPMAVTGLVVFGFWAGGGLFGRHPRWAVAWAVGAMGAAQMAFQVLLLFLYQIAAGALYAHVTVLISVCMAGLAAGSFAVRAVWAGKGGVAVARRGFLGVHGATAFFVGAIFPLLAGRGMEALRLWPSWAALAFFSGLGFLGAVAGGAHFALGCLLAEKAGLRRGAVGGLLYGTDLLGAAAAAVATPVLLVPLLGVPKVFLTYGLLLSLAWVTSWTALRRL